MNKLPLFALVAAVLVTSAVFAVSPATASAASVDLKINGSDTPAPVVLGTPVSLTWPSSGVGYCNTGSSRAYPYSWGSYNYAAIGGSATFTPTVTGNLGFGIQCAVDQYSGMIVQDWVGLKVTAPAIAITAPNGGETLTQGQTYTITWTSNVLKNVNEKLILIDYSNTKPVAKNIKTVFSNTNSYAWQIPTTFKGDKFKLAIIYNARSIGGGYVEDVSDNYFSISESTSNTPNPTPDPTTTPPAIDTFTSSVSTVAVGQPVTLSWTLSGGAPTSLMLDNGFGSVLGRTSYTFTAAIPGTYTIKLTAGNGAGSTVKTVNLTINSAAPVITAFTVSPATIAAGQSATLSWTLSGGAPATLAIDNGVGSVLNTNARTVSPTATTTYTLTAANATGTVTRSVTVTIGGAPAIDTFTVSSPTVAVGQSVTLNWTLSGSAPTALTLNGGLGPVRTTDTSYTFTALHEGSYILTLTDSNNLGVASRSVNLTITSSPAPAIDTFTSSVSTVAVGQPVTLSWTLSGGAPTSLMLDNGFGSVLGRTSYTFTAAIPGTYTIKLTAGNGAGSVTGSVNVTITSR